MTEDTSSKRADWYDEEYIPDEPPMARFSVAIKPKQFGKFAAGLTAIGNNLHVAMEASAKEMQALVRALNPEKTQSDYVLFPEPLEDPRERALRLAKQPHSMTRKNNFDRHGQLRY